MTLPLSHGVQAGAAFRRLVESEAPLLLLDLDGTLAPLLDDAARSRVPEATRRTIQALRRSGVHVVLVSGRSIAGVRRVAGMPVDAILGDHGARLLSHGRIRPWIHADRRRLTNGVRDIAPLVAATRGIVLEQKDRSLALHLRILGNHDHPTVREIARRLRRAGLRVLQGHRILDAQPPGVNKGVAVRRWLAHHAHDAVLYAGDDTTDMDAFRALRGRGTVIAVGPRATGAEFRTRDPRTFAAWLARLAAARAAR
jgi:trehalose 6-phosphate phosphatase